MSFSGSDKFLDVLDAEDLSFKTLPVPTDHESSEMTSARPQKGRVFCYFRNKGSVAVWNAKSGNLLTVIRLEIRFHYSLMFFKMDLSNEIAMHLRGGILRLTVSLHIFR